MTTNIQGERLWTHLRGDGDTPPQRGIACGAHHRHEGQEWKVRCCTPRIYDVNCPACLTIIHLRAAADTIQPQATVERVLARCHADDPARAIYRSVAS